MRACMTISGEDRSDPVEEMQKENYPQNSSKHGKHPIFWGEF